MKVFGFYHCPCIYESAAGLQSLHKTKGGAENAMEIFLEGYIREIEESNKWCLENGLEECTRDVKFSDYERVFVEEIEVQK